MRYSISFYRKDTDALALSFLHDTDRCPGHPEAEGWKRAKRERAGLKSGPIAPATHRIEVKRLPGHTL